MISKFRIVKVALIGFFLSFNFLFGQQPQLMNAVEIKIALKKLSTLGSVLYIAAHPDDENTAFLAYMSNERMMQTGYLSLTRGDGGQNLIGSEKGQLMGVIRTNELLAARKIDGAQQFFTRAIDFGFSKTSEESIAIWGKENIIEDIVWVIRKFKPDVIVTRFAVQDGGSGHGHHTASAILALEAFKAAGDPLRFPNQLNYVSVWQPKRIFWNTWRPNLDNTKAEDLQKLIRINVGKYNPMLGKSYYEIASLSRSMHKSQGFGAVPFRDQRFDYYQLLDGEEAKNDLFENIDTTWNRVQDSQKVRDLLEKADETFQLTNPQKILPLLMQALEELNKMERSYWKEQKISQLKEVIRSCAGLWLEAMCTVQTVIPGEEITVNLEAINRSSYPFYLKSINLPMENKTVDIAKPLQEGISEKHQFNMKLIEVLYTNPYWLLEKPSNGIYVMNDSNCKALPVAPYPIYVTLILEAEGHQIQFQVPVLYRLRDPVEGELIRPLNVMPPVTLNFKENVYYFSCDQPKQLALVLKSGPNPIKGHLKLELPSSWKAEGAQQELQIDTPFTQKEIYIKIFPPKEECTTQIKASVIIDNQSYSWSQVIIDYPHLPPMVLHPQALTQFVKIQLNRMYQHKKIGYIAGSGDDIPVYLSQVGFDVQMLSDEMLSSQDLNIYDVVVVGVRAYNTRQIFKYVQERLIQYIKRGGRMVVQYNTDRQLVIPQIGPYPFQITSDRITQEDAPMTVLASTHPLLNYPNKIKSSDFEGWVQERGLYFASKLDPAYNCILSGHDYGEEPLSGGLIYAIYGKGTYIYTGLSFFRQLPAGVPGAFKLFLNLLSK